MSDLFDFNPDVPRFAVMGNPVAHSKSPCIHAWFGRQTGIALEYTAIQVDIGGFEQAVDAFRASGGRGLNITVPFKSNAWDYADKRSPGAEAAGAVNTLVFDDSLATPCFGDNTDGSGLVRDIQENLGVAIAGRHVLIIGAGGASRGAVQPLMAESPASCVVANRTPDRASAIASDLNAVLQAPIEACGLDGVTGRQFDIVINATAASLDGAVPGVDPGVLSGAMLAYDMMYGDGPTAFLAWARDNGSRQLADGLGMLLEQAADAFALWHGVRPNTRELNEAMRRGEYQTASNSSGP